MDPQGSNEAIIITPAVDAAILAKITVNLGVYVRLLMFPASIPLSPPETPLDAPSLRGSDPLSPKNFTKPQRSSPKTYTPNIPKLPKPETQPERTPFSTPSLSPKPLKPQTQPSTLNPKNPKPPEAQEI